MLDATNQCNPGAMKKPTKTLIIQSSQEIQATCILLMTLTKDDPLNLTPRDKFRPPCKAIVQKTKTRSGAVSKTTVLSTSTDLKFQIR